MNHFSKVKDKACCYSKVTQPLTELDCCSNPKLNTVKKMTIVNIYYNINFKRNYIKKNTKALQIFVSQVLWLQKNKIIFYFLLTFWTFGGCWARICIAIGGSLFTLDSCRPLNVNREILVKGK